MQDMGHQSRRIDTLLASGPMNQADFGGRILDLARVPPAGRRPLRAWDTADEYLVSELAEHGPIEGLLVVGDRFGAVSCALDQHGPVSIVDSAAGRAALAENRSRNGLGGRPPISLLELDAVADASISHVALRVPKSSNELVDVLYRIRPKLTQDGAVLAAAMVKHLPSSALPALEGHIGSTTSGQTRKKARLLTAHVDPALSTGEPAWPKTWRAHGCTLTNHGGNFSAERLDTGTDLLLAHLEAVLDRSDGFDRTELSVETIVDLGCGNGIIGLVAAQRRANAQVVAIDDSAVAVDATRSSWSSTFGSAADRLTVHHAHRLVTVVDAGSVDAVLVNPPFHEDRVIGDDTAWSMFVDAHKVLRPGGVLGVVGNRHLAYHAKLKKIFGNVDVIASTSRFVVLASVR